MTRPTHALPLLICSIIVTASPLFGGVKLQVRDGRPIVDGVFVNGHGPYRFLVDTGSNVNLIESRIARKIGMITTFLAKLTSAAGEVPVSGSDGNEVALDSARADEQKFVFSELDAIHRSSPDIQGILGEWFLCHFDYRLDLRARRLEFGKQETNGTRSTFKVVNARPVVSTSLGDLALDSAASRLTLFGVRGHPSSSFGSELRTVASSRQVGMVSSKPLVIEGRKISDGDAVAIPSRPEAGVDGLLPLGLFKTIYICNSEGYVVFE